MTATQNQETIREAISRSMSHTECVHVTIAADDHHDAIHECVSASITGEWDYTEENRDEDGNQVYDVYSIEGEDDQWRIKVTFTEEA